VFKHQTFNVLFFSVSLKHSDHTPVWPRERIDHCDRCIDRWNHTANRFFLVNNTFSTMIKLFTPNMYCWSRKILVTIYWTHLRLNGICAKSFCPQQTNNRRLLLLWDDFNGNVAISNVYKWRQSDVIAIKLVARTQIKSPAKRIFRNFHNLETNTMTPFCNLSI